MIQNAASFLLVACCSQEAPVMRDPLVTEEMLTARTLALPTTRLPCGPFPKCRVHGQWAQFRVARRSFGRAARLVLLGVAHWLSGSAADEAGHEQQAASQQHRTAGFRRCRGRVTLQQEGL